MLQTFIHYRKHDKHAQIEARGGLTVAIRQDGRNVTYALAECSSKDNFEKKTGRIKSAGRLDSQHAVSLQLPEDINLNSPELATALKSIVFGQAAIQKKVAKLRAGGK